ncbi:hypothetical protein CTI12_AA011980 [Artemisia annua]|uniref:DUF8039 domain-containing protein n=1 Tax=Artemisia annua TaxID=35608 RepID=A0A2U1QMB3_ARTAN|nr:hypothetical protein CTI12_AA011980 [Artemisia annua]
MAGRGKRGASLGKKDYPPESFYVEFDGVGQATGKTAGRFNTWFGNTVRARTPYYLEWNKMKKETIDQLKENLWLHTMDTWRFLYDDKDDKAKDAQLGKVNRIHRTFRNTLVDFVRLNILPFDTYKYLPKNLEHWEMFVAYTTFEEFLVKSEKARQSALQNNDPARVGRSGYAGLRAIWKANKEKLIEKIPLLGLLQSERSILHVLGRMKKNQETGIKELTDFCRERLDALIKKEKEMKANGTFYITGNDPLIGVLGKEHGGRTRSVSSTQGSKKALGTNKGEMMQKVSMKDLESMAGKILEDVKPEINQLRADIETLKKIPNGMPSGVSGHITVDKFDEIESCEVMSIHFGKEVKVGKGIIYPTNAHGVPMEPGHMKIQVDTVYPGWEGLQVPVPTEEVTFLGDATKDARFIQWPKNYLKVLPTMPSSVDSMSSPPLYHPNPTLSSSPPLYYPTMSEPNCHLQVEEQLTSEAIMSQSAPKKISAKKLPPKQKNIPPKEKNVPPKQKTPPKQKQKKNHIVLPQEEPSTIEKYLKKLANRPINIRKLADKFINCPKHGDFILAPAVNGLYDGFYADHIFYTSVLGWMSNDWLDGTILHWWGMHLYSLIQKNYKDKNKCGILNPSWIDSRLCHGEDGDNVVKHIQSTLRVQKDNHICCTLFANTGYILDSLNKSLDKKPSIYSLIPMVEAECHDPSSVDWTWNMVKCPQQESTWECGYYVAIAMFELFFQKQSDFPQTVWNDMKPRTMRQIDEWVENTVPQFYKTHFSLFQN